MNLKPPIMPLFLKNLMKESLKWIYLSYLILNLSWTNVEAQGSCASTDGPNKEIADTPVDYQFLLDNGYCYTGSPMSNKDITMCFTLNSPGTDIEFNAGLTTNCPSYSINYARLYTSSPACVLIDATAIGITTGLNTGTAYTWCISLSGNGPPGCTFNSLCPWYVNRTVLPITLVKFTCIDGIISFITATEVNNSYFIVESSKDGIYWIPINTIEGQGNKSTNTEYYINIECTDDYVNLKSFDIDGSSYTYDIIKCDCKEENKKLEVTKVFNILGQEITEDIEGIRVVLIG